MRHTVPALLTMAVAAAVSVTTAEAQRIGMEVGVGSMVYDAGADNGYAMVRAAAFVPVTKSLRLGVAGAWSPIGASYSATTRTLVGDEAVYRIYGAAALQLTTLRQSETPIVNRITPWLDLNAGVFHSEGRTASTEPKTGPSFGVGVGLDFALSERFSIRGGYRAWQDFALATRLTDVDQYIGVTVGL